MIPSLLKRRVHLGLRLGPPTAPAQGPTVRAVAPGSCAEAAGVRPGDELIRIGAHATESIEDARIAQQALEVGALVHLGVRRERELLSLFGHATAFPLETDAGLKSQYEAWQQMEGLKAADEARPRCEVAATWR